MDHRGYIRMSCDATGGKIYGSQLLQRKIISKHLYASHYKALTEVLKSAENDYFEHKFSSLKSNPNETEC